MALSLAERAEVRRLLGYWDQTAGLYHALEGYMTALTAEAEDQVRTWLAEVEDIDAQISEFRRCRLKFKRTEDVVVAGLDELLALYQEGNRLARQIATTLGTPVYRYPYQSAPMSGLTGRM